MNREKYPWLYDVLFLLVFLLAGYLRFTGVNWGSDGGQHPDENHFSNVLGAIRAQKCADPSVMVEACAPEQKQWLSLGDYFNSQTSPLNPYNRGLGSYVYGNLPMTMIRIAADIRGESNLRVLGRQFSAFADLLAILFLYLLVSRLYGRRVGLLASLFSALTVMQIQQSHFFTVDLFPNAFGSLALLFAVAILEHRDVDERAKEKEEKEESEEQVVIEESPQEISEAAPQPAEGQPATPDSPAPFSLNTSFFLLILRSPLFLLSIGFGFALGMAMASKINIAPLAIVLPGAFVLRYLIQKKGSNTSLADHWKLNTDYWTLVVICLIAGGLATLISFRIFQPYAFDGIKLDPRWVADIKQQRSQATGEADLPWNLQWARRSHLYSFENLTLWGLGLPLGILAWAGFLYMGWRILKGEWRHALLWGWTAIYFLWQSLQFNPTMRYQLPIYPLLVMMAAWFVFEVSGSQVSGEQVSGAALTVAAWRHVSKSVKWAGIRKYVAGAAGVIVVVLTAIWAFAFHTIYLREEPRVAASHWIFQNVPGPINVQIQAEDSLYNEPLPFPNDGLIQAGQPYDTVFAAQSNGTLNSILLGHVLNRFAASSTIRLTLSDAPNTAPGQALATASLSSDFQVHGDPRGDSYTLKFDKPITLKKDSPYYLRIEVDNGTLEIKAATIANETDYDYPLPLRVDGYDAFGGIYRGDLNLQVYWDDNADKLNRFITTLNETDYLLIPTNHQYGQITRLPERYPLTTLYYRELIGCPEGKDIIWCYRTAKPGTFQSRLGYDLVAVFETFPQLGPIVINDQAAEEAFTFYDHPKVLIFKKNKDFNIAQVQAVLGSVDLSKVVHLLPRQFSSYSNLLLPANKLAEQRAGGTWSQLFNYNWLQNRYPVVGLVIWYVFIFILGLAIYPLARLAMPGLIDKGYPLSRALGLVLFGYLAWMAGSVGIPYTRLTIAIVFSLILIAGGALAYYQRAELREEWQSKHKYFLMIECLFLAFFLLDLFIRLGNPDLWHPYKGGERPMDFSYFNAVIKSTVFPPYDPWFAGGYINYYYYGFVLVGTPVKLLGIVPSIAYNFILPTLFAIVGVCAFSLGWNLVTKDEESSKQNSSFILHPLSFIGGLAAAALTILLGNLGTIQLVYQKLQELGAQGAFSWDKTITVVQRWTWAFQGFLLTLKGNSLPLGPGEWYWNPSRVVPPGGGGNEITEFPLFTFLYSDLHAHMIAIPLALLALSWALAVVAGRAKWRNPLSAALGLVIGGLIIGSFYPANLSDTYTYLLLGILAIGYGVFRYMETDSFIKRVGFTAGAVIVLFLLSHYLYEPYRIWYGAAYNAVDPWKGPYTPMGSYLVHWGVFLFIIVSWLVWETREWMAATPVSALQKLKPYQLLIEGALVLLVLAMLVFQFIGTSVGWIALPIAAWAAVLLLRPNLPDAKRFALFLIGTAMLITIVVEAVVVRGDIGRQNTIFKFYMEAWILLAISAGAALAWILPAFFKWLPGWRIFWQTAMVLLVSGALLFTVTGTAGKIRDRWITTAPHTLDSITYMKYAQFDDFGQRLDLSEDYRAIRWMQDNVQGSPVIVETNCSEYRWCTRFTIYTGLPGVVGWNWHQRQQRVFTSTWVEGRVAEIGDFYNSTDIEYTLQFLKKYDVSYIIVGQLEHAAYTPEGLAKFEQYNKQYWQAVYHDGNTVIYKVIP